jgi:hypothetical protein
MIRVKLDLAPKLFDRFSLKLIFKIKPPLFLSLSGWVGGVGGVTEDGTEYLYDYLIMLSLFMKRLKIIYTVNTFSLVQEKECKAAVEIFYRNGIYT